MYTKTELYELLEQIQEYYSDEYILNEFVLYMDYDMLKDYIETFAKNHDLKIINNNDENDDD